jgi:DNA-directed RNA polymerase subunit RPC12/RpoP
MTPYIPILLRRQVEQEAGNRCGYCRSSLLIMGSPLEVEHIIPVSEGGETALENLWLACHRCNRFKSNRIHAQDPETGEDVPPSILVASVGSNIFNGAKTPSTFAAWMPLDEQR